MRARYLVRRPYAILDVFLLRFVMQLVSTANRFLVLVWLRAGSGLFYLYEVGVRGYCFLSGGLAFFSVFCCSRMGAVVCVFRLLHQGGFAYRLFRGASCFFISMGYDFSFMFSSVRVLGGRARRPSGSGGVISVLIYRGGVSRVRPIGSYYFWLVGGHVSTAAICRGVAIIVASRGTYIVALHGNYVSYSGCYGLRFFLLFI